MTKRLSSWLGYRDPNNAYLYLPAMELYRYKMWVGAALSCGFLLLGTMQDQWANPGIVPRMKHDGRSMVT